MLEFRRHVALLAAFAVVSCSASDEGVDPPGETVEQAGEALTGSCNSLTFGHPCDPDGAAGPKLECQGVCWVGTNGGSACVPIENVGITSMDGRVCGTFSGYGSNSCANSCLNGACIAIPAKAGTACRPFFNSDSCDGACNATGQCGPLSSGTSPCPYGRSGFSSCTFAACNMNQASQCQQFNLPKDTTCGDGNLCTISDACDGAGTCTGAPKNCNDNNVCTTDTCNPANGACLGQPNTQPCDDGDKCTTGDTCGAAVCQAGTKVDCDDKNACTVDSCNPATGCVHTPKVCTDGDACTTDGCDATSGACTFTKIDCNDNDPCTTDSCNSASGCVNTPISGCGTGGTGGTGGATGGTGGTGGGTTGGHTETKTDPNSTGKEASIPVCCVPSSTEKTRITEGFNLLNQHRIANGKSALAYDTKLEAAIEGHCHHMAVHSFWGHDAPEASVKSPWTRANLCGTSAGGENIFMGSTSAATAMNAWINSPGHNANMLNGSFKRVGIGNYNSYWGQIFGY